VFVNSMSDLFHEAVPFEFVNEVFAVMSMTPQHTYQILTKRPERMAKYMLLRMGRRPLPNVWLGTSVENQTTADERIPHLLRCPAAVRFLSCEPLLGPISFSVKCPPEYQPHIRHDRIGWVITGGESGPGARPCNVEWIRSIVLRCKAAQVPVFVKQLGAKPYDPSWHGNGTTTGSAMNLNDSKGGDPDEWSDDLRVREMPVANTAQAGGAVTR
jgi:protein gp37